MTGRRFLSKFSFRVLSRHFVNKVNVKRKDELLRSRLYPRDFDSNLEISTLFSTLSALILFRSNATEVPARRVSVDAAECVASAEGEKDMYVFFFSSHILKKGGLHLADNSTKHADFAAFF